MRKLAIFVEGQTELIFVEKLLLEIAGRRLLHVDKLRAFGGQTRPRQLVCVEVSKPAALAIYYVQIVDCGGDNKVKSDISERYDSLVNAGFQAIIGIRDVFPLKRSEVSALRKGLRAGLASTPIKVEFVLGVMEIESWFISEYTHFQKISPRLTMKRIKAKCGFDPSTDNSQHRRNPSRDLHDIYRIAGLSYDKSRSVVQRTVRVLDYARIYMDLVDKIADLETLIAKINLFLSEPPGAISPTSSA